MGRRPRNAPCESSRTRAQLRVLVVEAHPPCWELRTHPPTTSPPSQFINDFGENYRTHSFSDPQRLAQWSQHGPYRYNAPLVADTPRDLSEARARRDARLQAAVQ